MKNALPHIVNYERTIFGKKKCKLRHNIRQKFLEYFKIQEGLPSENLTEYYLYKGIWLSVFVYSERYYYISAKLNKSLNQLKYDYLLKIHFRGMVSFRVSSNLRLKTLRHLGTPRAFRGHSDT